MSIPLTIGSRIIEFPSSGQDPAWSQGVIDFAEAVAAQLQAIASPFDIPPTVQILTSNANVNLNLDNAIFPSGSVRSFTLYYAIYRTNGVNSYLQQGEVAGQYDTLNAAWYLNDSFSGTRQANGTPYQIFNMSGDQLQISLTAIGGTYDTVNSTISFSAKTELTTE